MKGKTQVLLGVAGGGMQGATVVLLQLLPVSVAVGLGLRPGALGWIVPVGLFVPLATSLVMALGDAIGGKRMLVATAAATATGVALIAAGGLLVRLEPAWALAAVVAGALLAPAAIRFGDLLVIHTTRKSYADQRRIGRTLRALLVVSIYAPVLAAGWIGQHVQLGWAWVFGGYAALLAASLPVLLRCLPPDPRVGRVASASRRPSVNERAAVAAAYGRALFAIAIEPRMVWAGTGVLLARTMVFGYVAGLPIVLAGHSSTLRGLIQGAAILAAPIVAIRWKSNRRLAVVAGLVPITALTALQVATLGSFASAVSLIGLSLASAGTEACKQNSQQLTMIQAREGRPSEHSVDFRAQAILNLHGNVGAIVGTSILPALAHQSPSTWLLGLLVLALAAWTLQASWFTIRHRPPGRHRSRAL